MKVYKIIGLIVFALFFVIMMVLYENNQSYIDCSADVSIYSKDFAFTGNYLIVQDSSDTVIVRIVGTSNLQNRNYSIDRNFKARISKVGSDNQTMKLDIIKGSVKSADDLSNDNSMHSTSWVMANKDDIYKISKILSIGAYGKSAMIIKSPDFSVMLCIQRK